ncbi:uncharacterized protein ACBT57_016891 [Dama dama]
MGRVKATVLLNFAEPKTGYRSVRVSCGRAQTRKDPEKLEGHPGPAGWELPRTGWPSCKPARRGGVLAPPPGGPSAREPPHPEVRPRCAASSPSPIETETIPRIWLRFSARDPKAEPRSQASKDRQQKSLQHRLVGLGTSASFRFEDSGSLRSPEQRNRGSRRPRSDRPRWVLFRQAAVAALGRSSGGGLLEPWAWPWGRTPRWLSLGSREARRPLGWVMIGLGDDVTCCVCL